MLTFEQMLTPIWDTDIVYGESFTMYRNENGEISADFLYEPQEIIEVKSASFEAFYEEDKDYFIKDGKLHLKEGTKIPFMEFDKVFMRNYVPGKSFAISNGYLFFDDGIFFHNHQIAVTYKCQKGAWQGYKPEYKGDILHKTIKRLTTEKALKIVLFGDSISAGFNASGKMLTEPFQPGFCDLFAEKLRREYNANITIKNSSVGGKNSYWGMEVLDEKVIEENADLVIIAFGMNDICTPEEFETNIRNMVDRIKAANADTDIILVATSTPNPLLSDEKARFWWYQHRHGEALKSLEADGIAVLDIGALQKELHRKKRFIDTTGNNVNHPNDFFIRVHAQALSALLVK